MKDEYEPKGTPQTLAYPLTALLFRLVGKLKDDGHTEKCARFQVWGPDGNSTGSCICKGEGDDA